MTNAEILTDLLLTASFANKDVNAVQNIQSSANTQSAQRMSDALKDKIVSSMNTALNNPNANLGGSFNFKSNPDRTENLKEKFQPTPPQVFKAMDRVETALKEAAKSRDGKTISLRLDPPELGSVKIDVTLKDGTLHARLSADSQTVNNLLREYSHDLQLALRKLGIAVDRVTVSINQNAENFDLAQHDNTQNEQSMTNNHEKQKAHSDLAVQDSSNFIENTSVRTDNNVDDHWVA